MQFPGAKFEFKNPSSMYSNYHQIVNNRDDATSVPSLCPTIMPNSDDATFSVRLFDYRPFINRRDDENAPNVLL